LELPDDISRASPTTAIVGPAPADLTWWSTLLTT
jgi:hypothetical protein